MNLRESIVATVKEVLADAENSGVAQNVEALVQQEVAKLEASLKQYIDAQFQAVFATLTSKPVSSSASNDAAVQTSLGK